VTDQTITATGVDITFSDGTVATLEGQTVEVPIERIMALDTTTV
jgi:hypothetical protein